jgi:hypothetical protein
MLLHVLGWHLVASQNDLGVGQIYLLMYIEFQFI